MHLLRFNLIEPRTGLERMDEERIKQLHDVDEQLSSHFDVHALDIPYEYWPGDMKLYGRDVIMEWDDAVYTTEGLYQEMGAALSHFLKSIGITKELRLGGLEAEGGKYIRGKRFSLVTETDGRQDGPWTSENNPHYFVCPGSMLEVGHVDMDHAIIDNAQVIYASELLYQHSNQNMISRIRSLARTHDYELREFPGDQRGINMISNGSVFTISMDTAERKHLEAKGVETIVIDYPNIMDPKSGLRCLYAQF